MAASDDEKAAGDQQRSESDLQNGAKKSQTNSSLPDYSQRDNASTNGNPNNAVTA
jgi:hypothetical protein